MHGRIAGGQLNIRSTRHHQPAENRIAANRDKRQRLRQCAGQIVSNDLTMLPFTLILCLAIGHLSNFVVRGSPVAVSDTSTDSPDVWLTYMNKAMGRHTQIFGVAPQPDIFDNIDDANNLFSAHSDSHLVIAYSKWALAVGDTVYAFASDEFNRTISDAVTTHSVVKEEHKRVGISPMSKRDHPFSWWGRWGNYYSSRCVPGFPCEDDDDCAPYACLMCVEEVGNPNSRQWCEGDE